MTEKNTLSILENIKKKMQKFDQEPKKIETVAGINDEFEYIPSSKTKSAETNSGNESAKHDLGIDKDFFAAAPASNNTNVATAKPAAVQNYGGMTDDLGLDDLSDLDDDVQTAPVLQTPVAPASNQAAPANKDDDIFHELEVDEEKHDEPKMENLHEEAENSHEEKAEEDDIFHELNLDEDHHEAAVEEQKSEVKKEEHDDFDLDLDLNLDDELLENQSKKADEKIVEEKAALQNVDEIDLDKLLAEEVKAEEPTAETPTQSAMTAEDEDFLRELEKNDPIKPQVAAVETQNQPVQAAPATPVAPVSPVASTAPAMVSITSEKSITEDLTLDADLDDLDDIEEHMEEDFLEENKESEHEDHHEEDIFAAAPESKAEEVKAEVKPQVSVETKSENQDFSAVGRNILESKIDSWMKENLHQIVEKIVQEEVRKLFEKR